MEPQSVELKRFNSSKPIERVPLRVLLDARKLGDGGIGVYTGNLITGLVASPGKELTVLVPSGRENLIPQRTKVKVIIDEAKSYSLDELLLMPRRIDFSKFDVFHATHFPLPFGIPIPTILTIHDTIHLSHPEKRFYPTIAKYLLRSSMRRASGVITVSQASKRALIALCREVVSKIRVVPNAIGANLFTSLNTESQLDFPYILAVFSNKKPHKGFNDLIEAFKAAKPYLGDIQLVVAGSGVSASSGSISDHVKVIGPVSDSQLKQLYAGARFLVMPSLMEGFSLPVLEAKSQGTPIVSRPVPAVTELLEEGDYICSDMSVAALSAGLVEGMRRFDSEIVRTPSQKLLEKYSVNHTAEQVLEVYQAVSATTKDGVS